MRIALLGLGLIGGSIALALRARASDGPRHEIVAWSPSGEGPAAALRDGTIDGAAPSPTEALQGADLIVLAGPAPTVREQLDALGAPWRSALSPDAVITDVASTKLTIMERASALGLRFVGGHPMAGRETSGYSSAEPDLFVDEVVKDRADRSLAHVFTLLSLILPAEPLQIAFRGLHTDDQNLRGTALEYLESVLPPQIRERLWPFLEDTRPVKRSTRQREDILADLLRSNESIALNLAELQRRARSAPPRP